LEPHADNSHSKTWRMMEINRLPGETYCRGDRYPGGVSTLPRPWVAFCCLASGAEM
jgi:hypothetical protein